MSKRKTRKTRVTRIEGLTISKATIYHGECSNGSPPFLELEFFGGMRFLFETRAVPFAHAIMSREVENGDLADIIRRNFPESVSTDEADSNTPI